MPVPVVRPHSSAERPRQVAGCAFFRNEVRFSPDGQLMAANSHDFTVSLYDPSDGVILHTFPPHASTVTDLAFSPDGERLVTASDDSTMRVWSVADHQLLQEYATPPGGYWSMVFAGDGRSLVVSDVVGVVSVIDVEDRLGPPYVRRPEESPRRAGDLPRRLARRVRR